MNLILVSDVYGMTPALSIMGEQVGAETIVDPYNGEQKGFRSEDEAYIYFMKHVGLDSYLEILNEVAESCISETVMIGFSVGAAAIWRLSEKTSAKNIQYGVCYYGSQIRNYRELKPRFEVSLIFPEMEKHFDVSELYSALAERGNVSAVKLPYLHGFMNSLSPNYSNSGYMQQLVWLREKRVNKAVQTDILRGV